MVGSGLMQIDVSAVMDAIGDAIESTGVKRVYRYPADSVTPPCAVIGYPTDIRFDATFGRGSDAATFPVYYVVSSVNDRTTRDALTSTIKQIKNAIDGLTQYAALCSEAKVQGITVGAIAYLAVEFTVQVET